MRIFVKRLGMDGLRVAALACGLAAAPAWATCTDGIPWRGVNLAGAEFGHDRMPGRMFHDYTYPTAATLDYFADKGATAIRLPVRWERVQPALRGALAPAELEQIRRVAASAKANGQCLILDLHNFARYGAATLGAAGGPSPDDLLDVWKRLAAALPADSVVALGLMNEPAHVETQVWAGMAQQLIKGLREAGVRHWIVSSGGRWAGAHSWFGSGDGVSNAVAFAGLSDPLRRTVIEVHQYADGDGSGRGVDCMSASRMRQILMQVSDWARKNRQTLLLGEFGVAGSAECLVTLRAQLDVANGSAWKGWTYWAAGEWWGNYAYSVQPAGGVDRPQMPVLEKGWSN